MPHQIWVIHGGNAFDTYEAYLTNLREKEVSIERLRGTDWKASLEETLGADDQVLLPRMPNSQNARYLEWKIYFERLQTIMAEQVILVGHSLGGIFLAKYLSEASFPKQILGTLLVAAPFSTADSHPLVDFTLTTSFNQFTAQAGKTILYHSQDDAVVPYSNALEYQQALPQAELRTFSNRGHFNDSTFPELVADIREILA